MTDLEALKYTLETGKSMPPGGCNQCHYYIHPKKCKALSEENAKLCVKNGCKAGIRSIYVKLIE